MNAAGTAPTAASARARPRPCAHPPHVEARPTTSAQSDTGHQRAPDHLPARALPPAFADISRIIVNRKENAATHTAALIIPAVGNNKLRHETLQHFMLANDSVTVAIEIPIWLREHDIAALEWQLGVEIASRSTETRIITGHLDFLQIRNGAVHILDYKPDAGTNKPIAQLTIYALALTLLVPGLRLFDIKCAWFNEHEYCECFPRTLFVDRHR
jgi:ATP-dependent exoDNAse (exonuclease V) beta subunit